MSGARQRLRRVVLDVSPLREYPAYRRLWMGQSINVIGSQVTRVALPYQVYVLTHSTLAIAGLTLVQLIPLLLFSLGGGSLADVVDRRRLLLVTQVALGLSSLALAIVSLGQPPLWLLFAIGFVAAAFGSIDQPTRASSTPRLVPAHRLPAAIALNQLSFNAGSVIGPAIGGLILAGAGVSGAYLVDVVTYGVSIVAILGLPAIPPLVAGGRAGIAAIRESLSFVRGRRVILSTFAIDLNAMIFGMPTALFPALALDVFHAGPVGVGLLNAAPAAGAFIGVALSGLVTRLRQLGRGIIVAVVVWGAAIALFGLSTFSFPLALGFLAIAGAADVLSAVLRSTLVQLTTPDELRGRVSAIHILVVTSGPRIGDIEAAGVAAVMGAQLSAISGGLLCVLGVIGVARLFPELDRQLRPEAPPAPARPTEAAT
ncbi:MAG TPA: MFS transporter [Candidatus Acidoferrales bacterium]|nr:MFS transporter [Candidatus Acidoferrales bacterium]